MERLPGRRMRLLEMVDLADMLRRMGKLETDALAVPAGRETPAFNHGDLVGHVGVRRIVRDGVDAGLRHDLARLEFLRHGCPPSNLSTIPETECNRTAFRAGLFRHSRPLQPGACRRGSASRLRASDIGKASRAPALDRRGGTEWPAVARPVKSRISSRSRRASRATLSSSRPIGSSPRAGGPRW
jgi:hypothetical protein